MTSTEQKNLLSFLRKVEKWRKHRQNLEAAAKKKEPAIVRKWQTEIQLDHMHIDRELDDMLKICQWEQLDLFSEKK